MSISHALFHRAVLSLLVAVTVQYATDAAAQCDRACLENFVNRYLDSVIAHDPSLLPLATDVKYTENGQQLVPGDGLWNTASGRGSYNLYAADPEAGQAGFIGTIFEGGVPAILGLRLKTESGGITEIEAFVVRDEIEAASLDSIGTPHPRFVTAVPPAERAPRADLVRVANMYFTGLERDDGKGEYPFTDDCDRLEDGHYTTNHPSLPPGPGGAPRFDINAMGCKEQFELGFFAFVTRIRDRRFVVVDRERGLVFAFGFFDHAGNVRNVRLTNGMTFDPGVRSPFTWEIAELFKIENGLISQIQALYQEAPYGMNSGWSTWEEGLSNLPR